MPTPIVILGDAPTLATGLGRIARDLAAQLWRDREALGIALVQIGWAPASEETPALVLNPAPAWPCVITQDRGEDWLARLTANVYTTWFGETPGVILSVWDPARCFALAHTALPPDVQRWGYFAVDATNVGGGLSGPLAATIAKYDRVLAYGRWGSRALRSASRGPVAYLPHGIVTETWATPATADEITATRQWLGHRVTDQTWLIGVVASNQPRKDLALATATIAELRKRGHPAHLWLHTDRLVGSGWSVPQLIEDDGIGRAVTVTTSLTDRQLAVAYQLCTATLAPGLGEGFGYPIVESLAAGTPCVHHTYGGGTELVPRSEWTIPVRGWRREGIYAMVRPILVAEDAVNALERVVAWRRSEPDGGRAYCQGQVAALDWAALWLRWVSWIRTGLHAL